MMIVTDSSVIIDSTRKTHPHLIRHFSQLPVAICGVIWTEVATGAKSIADRQRIDLLLNNFAYIPFSEALWSDVATNLSRLRESGIVVPFNDVVITTLTIHSGFELWTRDQHFSAIQNVLPSLRLFAEPA